MNALTELIQNDSHAASFQSLAQYRAALISAASPQQVTKRGVYLSGPMTGLPEFNFPAFNAAAEDLRSEGLDVINPADHGVVDGWEWSDYLRRDIALLVTCSEIIMLPGWSQSKGAQLEHHIATQLGMAVGFYKEEPMTTTIPTIPGTPFAGGFFIARYTLNGQEYALIDSGTAGELKGTWGEYGKRIEGADSDTDGRANTAAMIAAESPIALSTQALRINGHDDWHLPSRYEQALQYFALQEAEGYQADQAEAFETDDWYWSSTQYSPDYAWGQDFGGGDQLFGHKDHALRARAVRRFVINSTI